MHLNIIISNKENLQMCTWVCFCVSVFVSLTSIIIEILPSSFSFAKMVKEFVFEGLHYVGKGENINWVRVATSIVREKAQRKEMHILKSGGSMALSKLNGAEEVSHKLPSSILALKFEEPKLTNKFCIWSSQRLAKFMFFWLIYSNNQMQRFCIWRLKKPSCPKSS